MDGILNYFSAETWWSVLAVVCLILEMLTAGFAVACFSIGAVLAAIVSAIGLGITWQLLLFAAGSAVCLFAVRPLVLKYMQDKNTEVLTNVDALAGRKVSVVTKIEADGFGEVKVDGDVWKAQMSDGSSAEVGEKVIVKSRDSLILTVEKIN